MNNKLVSILIPLYNSEKYIQETIESCLNQTYKNIEIVVVDDGSSDNSFNLALEFSKKHKNVFVYQQSNSGAPKARNLAFQKSKGDYIQYLDADDLLEKNKILTQIERFKNSNEKTIIFGDVKYFEKDKNFSWNYNSITKDYRDAKEFLLDLWSSSNSVLIHSWLTPRHLIEEVHGWDEQILKNQDGVFFAKVASISSQVIYKKESIVYCRVDNTNSISRKKSPKSEASRLTSYEEYEKIFQDELVNEKVKKALATVYSDFIFNNYPENKELCKQAHQKITSFGFKEPLYRNISLYKNLAPFFGIYNTIGLHKKLSFVKQKIKKLLRG
ncbi:MAG: glycosyltransferase family 2 protein [Epsilonproteobacteria bacterium]|nr:glycosyltransferase family 2 protein [Campylobacterota bacterium]